MDERGEDASDDDNVRAYLAEISDFPLLTAEDAVRLAKAIEAGDETATRVLIESNLRLVVSIAKRYQQTGMQLIDLIQEGNLGLLRAVEHYDWRGDATFTESATWWIRDAINRAVGGSASEPT